MAGPWERYRQQSQPAGPWQRYAQQPAAPAQPAASDLDAFMSGTGAFSDAQGAPPADVAPPMSGPQRLGRSAQLGAQAVGRGLAGVAGMPFDLAGAGVDIGLATAEGGINLMRDEPVQLPRLGAMPLGYEHLTSSAGDLMEAIGVPPIEREDMDENERLLGDVTQFATEGGVLGAGLSRAARQRFPNGQVAGKTPRTSDAFLRPYVNQGPRPVVTDVMAGGGAGVGYNLAEENAPDSDLMKALGMVAGGIGGATLSSGPDMVRGAGQMIDGYRPSDIPYGPEGIATVPRRVVQHTRNFMEQQLTDPTAARQNVADKLATARSQGDPMPTTGIASDDIGFIAMERGARTKNSVPFEEADQLLVDSAQQRVAGLRDPGADQGAVRREVQQRPEQLKQDREAAALPLLRQAEQSGATVDPQPVVDTIDRMLGEAKRPAVVNSLREARRMLNRAGSEELDTSVSGLYETRKAINDIIEGRSETPTGQWAKKELIEVRDALDTQINAVAPEFGQYLDEFRQGSRPLDVFRDSDAVAKLAETDPRNVAQRVLSGSEYGTEGMLREVNQALQNNPEAQRGWKAAVADVLVDKVTNTNTALTRSSDGPLSVAKMQRVWKQHEGDLAQIFTPDEMAAARRAHEMLEPLGNLSRRATSGSPTANLQQLTNAMEAGILAYTGNAIKTGMIMKRLKVAASLVPGVKDMTLEAKMQNLVQRMYFDPELFIHVMDQPVRTMERPEWNSKLNRLLAYNEALRAEPTLLDAIEVKPEDDSDFMEAIGGR